MAKTSFWEQNYMCTGENWNCGVPIGYCGDIKTLREWALEFWSEDAVKGMANKTEKYVLDSFTGFTSKRLERVS